MGIAVKGWPVDSTRNGRGAERQRLYVDLAISGSINPESYRGEDGGEATTDGIDLGSQWTMQIEPAISRTDMTTTKRSARREARREAGCNIQS
jgi:hypothetical protein